MSDGFGVVSGSGSCCAMPGLSAKWPVDGACGSAAWVIDAIAWRGVFSDDRMNLDVGVPGNSWIPSW